MVVIPITGNLFSVTTTLLSTLSELGLYRTLRRVLMITQCRVLSKNKILSIRSQQRQLTAIAWGSLTIFLVLELVLSIYSDPVIIPRDIVEKCTQLVPTPLATRPLTAGDLGDEARVRCRKINLDEGFFVKEFSANISAVQEEQNTKRAVRCAQHELYGYFRGEQENYDVRNHTKTCVGEICVYVIVEGKHVYISARPTQEERSLEANKTWFPFLKTRVMFIIPSGHKREMAMRLAQAMERGERDEERLRALTLLGMRTSRCVRVDDQVSGRDGTEVDVWLLVGACVIWTVTSMAALGAESRWVRRMGFFDIGCEVQWARKSFRTKDTGEGDVAIRRAMVDGEQCIEVVQVNST